jgi:recombination protein RecA
MKIGIMFGNPETTTGGNALKFYSSVRLDIRQRDKIMKDGNVIGHSRRVKVVKNKMAPPFKEATFDMIYPMGIDKESSILDAAVDLGVVEKSGAWYKYGDEQLAQGREASIEELKSDQKLRDKIEKEVREKAKL